MTVDTMERRAVSGPVSPLAGAAGTVPASYREAREGRPSAASEMVRPRVHRPQPVFCPAPAAREGYRMSRFERLGMTVVVVIGLIVGAIAVTTSSSSQPLRDVVVRPGDTMLSLVLREVPQWEPARAVEVIESVNDLSDVGLVVGQVVRVPAQS